MKGKRFARVATTAVAAMALGGGIAACGSDDDDGGGGSGGGGSGKSAKIALLLPETKTARYESQDRPNFERKVKELCSNCEIIYSNADQDPAKQLNQVEAAITKQVDVMVLDPVDSASAAGMVAKAKAQDIPVISYDRLIRESPNVDFYVTFDNFQVGVAQGNALLRGLGLQNEDGSPGTATGPFNVELFAGSLDDNNAFFFWDGAMSVLQPLIDDGTLVVKSGQTSIEQAAILRWQQETAQRRMEDLLTSAYNDGSRVDGVLSPYDGLSRGIITALQNAGYGPTLDAANPMAVVTGQDAEIASVKLIADGVQSSTIFKDTRLLAEQAVAAASAFAEGNEPEANDTETYDNGVKVVPSYLLESDIVYKDNIQTLLVDSGYWTADEVASGVAE